MIKEMCCRNDVCTLNIKVYRKMQWYCETLNANNRWHFNIYKHDKYHLRDLKQETCSFVGI